MRGEIEKDSQKAVSEEPDPSNQGGATEEPGSSLLGQLQESATSNGSDDESVKPSWLNYDRGSVLFFVLASALVSALCFIPRPVAPWDAPILVISPEKEAEVIARDAKLAKRNVPGESALEAERIFRETGIREAAHRETRTAKEPRREAMRRAMLAIEREHGPDAVAILRAKAMSGIENKLTGAGSENERAEIMGDLPAMLERHGVTRRGTLVAPMFVARTLFKARWNLIHERPMTDGFAPIELQAYWGWLARSPRAPAPMRIDALRDYARAGGPRVEERLAVTALEGGAPEIAAEHYARAFRQTGGLRLRNHALFLLPD